MDLHVDRLAKSLCHAIRYEKIMRFKALRKIDEAEVDRVPSRLDRSAFLSKCGYVSCELRQYTTTARLLTTIVNKLVEEQL